MGVRSHLWFLATFLDLMTISTCKTVMSFQVIKLVWRKQRPDICLSLIWQCCSFCTGLIHKAYKAKAEGTDFQIWGTGKPLRQFIYSLDLAKLFVWAVRDYEEVEPIILSVDEADEISIDDVSKLVLNAFEFKGNVVYLTEKADGQYKKTASNEKLRKYLPDFQFTPTKKAIEDTVNWFNLNYDVARKWKTGDTINTSSEFLKKSWKWNRKEKKHPHTLNKLSKKIFVSQV